MTTTKLHPQMTVSFAVIALSLLTAVRMDAQCAAMHKGSAFAPDLRSVPESLPADQDDRRQHDEQEGVFLVVHLGARSRCRA